MLTERKTQDRLRTVPSPSVTVSEVKWSARLRLPQTLAVATTAVALAAFLQTSNARTLVSWHGFLHTAIANRFPGSFGTPDNPFFAGEPLPYYWFYHYVAAGLAWI